MIFENQHIYHIFNQGNNRQLIFFNPDNYLFFLNKIKTHITPYADILAWCLMPNHFHLMVFISGSATSSRAPTKPDSTSSRAPTKPDSTSSRAPTKPPNNFNKSIGIMLSSYTRAIQKQEMLTGSLFRNKTKAECLTKIDDVAPSFYNTAFGTIINIPNPAKEYLQICFNYIHNNPVKAGLAKQPQDWEFSSYRDYCGLRNGKLINKEKAIEFGLSLT